MASNPSIVGRQTTAGAAEETLSLSKDGAAAATTVNVAANKVLRISEVVITSGSSAIARFRLQQTNDGSTFFDIALLERTAVGMERVQLATPLEVIGGTNVAIRARVETPSGAALVGITVHGSIA